MEPQPDSVLEALSRIEDLLKIVVRQLLRETLDQELRDDSVRKVFDLTGTMSRDELVRATGVSAGKISSLWVRWESLGLLVRDGRGYKKRF